MKKVQKKFARKVSFMLACLMGMSNILPAVASEVSVYEQAYALEQDKQSAPIKVYLAEDFAAYKGLGKAPSGFELTGIANVKNTSGAFTDAENGVCVNLKVEEKEEATPDVGLAKRFGSDDIVGQYIVDFDIKMLDSNGSVFIELKDSLNKGITIGSIGNGKLTVFGKNVSLETGKWHRLSFAINFEQGVQTVTVYVDGVEAHKDITVNNTSGIVGTNYVRVRAKRKVPEQLTGNKEFNTLIDNMRVYTGTELKTMQELEDLNVVDSLMDIDNDLGISVADRLDQSVAMVVGSKYALIKNQRKGIKGGTPNAPRKVDGQMMVPLRVLGNQFGKVVEIQNNQVSVDGVIKNIPEAIFTTNDDVLVPLEVAGNLLEKHTYTDYKGRGLIVIGDNPSPFDDSKDKVDENVKPVDNEKFFIEEAIKQVVYDRPTGAQVIGDLKTADKAHPRILAIANDFSRVKSIIQSGEPTMVKWYSDIKKLGEKHLQMALPTDDLPDGRRMISSRQVGPLVINLSMLYRLSDDEVKKAQYKDRIWAEVETVAGFDNWNEDNEFLNTAEFMEGLAIAYDWMYDEWTPEQRKVMEEAMINKGLIKVLEAYNKGAWWMRTYPRANNWNAVCNGSAVLTLMAIGDIDREIKLPSKEVVTMEAFAGKITDVALNALEDFILLEFTPDGAWAEGPSYWKYTLEYLIRFMSSVETATGKTYGYDQTPGIGKTAYFPTYLTGPVGSLNYGDASSGKIKSPEVLWVAKKYKDKTLASVHLDNKEKYKFAGTELEMLWYEPSLYAEGQSFELDQYFSGTEVATFRSKWEDPNTSFLGFKAGNNVVSHGHYDLGSFVFEALGQQWAIDIGKDDYNLPGYSKYDADRLEYYRLNPQGHNTLLINPDISDKRDKQQDIKAFSKIENYQSKPLGGFTIANLTDAYEEKGVKEAYRGVMLTDNRTRATVQDEIQFNYPSKFYWFMHTEAEIEVSEDGRSAILSKGGEKLWVGLDCNVPEAKFTVLDAKPLPGMHNPPKQNQNVGIRKLTVELDGVEAVNLTVNMIPVIGEIEDIGTNLTTVPLANWNIPDGELVIPVLSEVAVDGKSLESFNQEVFSYDINLPLDRVDVPEITLTYDEILYEVTITQAPEVPGTTKVVVASKQNPGIKSIYHFNFKLVPEGGEDTLLQEIDIVAVNASAEQADKGNVKANAIDNNYNTYWAAEGDQWIEFDLGKEEYLNSVAIAFVKGNERAFKFEILTSLDGVNWTKAFAGASSGESLELEKVYVRKQPARYVRILGHGNSVNQWNSYAEVKLYTLPEVESENPVLTVESKEQVKPGERFEITVGINNVKLPIYAEDLTVKFDKDVLRFVEAKGIDPTKVVGESQTTPGEIRVLGFTQDGVTAETNLMTLVFEVKSDAVSQKTNIEIANIALGVVEGHDSQVVVAHNVQKEIQVKKMDIELDKAPLIELINEAEKLYRETATGEKPGEYPVEAKEALRKAIDKAQTALTNISTTAELEKEIDELNEAIRVFKLAVHPEYRVDVNEDGKVDVADLALVAYYYQADSTSTNWSEAQKADVNGDDVIDVRDLAIIANKILNK